MLFIISFVIAALIAMFCDKAMRKAPQAFYIGAAVLALFFCVFDFKNANDFVKNYIVAMFTKGTLATALFVIVMFTGAVKNGSYLMKKLMPVRAQLSIIASILILIHGFNYGKIYITRLIKAPDSFPAAQLVFIIFSAVMLLIMIPLAVISFKKIRSKMKPKRWKNIQRAAYVFYGLIYLHILLAYLPAAQKGNKEKMINVIVYSVVFITYAAMRISKAVLKKHKESGKTISISFGSAGFALMAAVCALVFIPYAQNLKEVSEPVANAEIKHSNTESISAQGEDNGTAEIQDEQISEDVAADEEDVFENKQQDTETASNSSSKKSTDTDKKTSSNSSSTSSKKTSSNTSSKNTQTKSQTESKTENNKDEKSSSSSGSNKTSGGTSSKSAAVNTNSNSGTASKTAANNSTALKSNTASKSNTAAANTASKASTSSNNNTAANTTTSRANTNTNTNTNTNQNNNNNVSSREEVVSVKEPEPTPEPEPVVQEPEEPVVQSKYRDGTYEAKAFNYEYDLVVKVTIENDVITKIDVEAFEDDMWYFEQAKDKIVPQILDKQSTDDIDAVSESTISSDAIKKAVNDALEQAKN